MVDSARVLKAGPSMFTFTCRRCERGLWWLSQPVEQCAQFVADRIGERDMSHDAAAKEGVFKVALGAVEELIDEHDVARFVLLLERANGADADDPRDAEFFIAQMLARWFNLAGQNAMTARMTREENHFASGERAGEQFIRTARRTAS